METKAKSSKPRKNSRGEVCWLVVSDARGNSSLGTEIWACGESWARSRPVSPVTHRVTAAAAERASEGGMRLTFSAVGGFGAVFGGEGEGGFNEAGVGQVPRPYGHTSTHPGAPRHAAQQRICRTKTHISIEGVK